MACLKNFIGVAAGLSCLFSVEAQAQGFYAKFGGGYNWGIGGMSASKTEVIILDNTPDFPAPMSEKAKSVKLNYGKGWNGSATVGYMFTDKLGTELEISYLAGGSNKSSYHSYPIMHPEQQFIRDYQSYARMLLFQPGLVFNALETGPWNLYGKFGIITGMGIIHTKTYRYDYYNNVGIPPNTAETTTAKYFGGWGFGLAAALGVNYKLNAKLGLFSEIKMGNFSFSPRYYKVEKIIINGEKVTLSNNHSVKLVNSYNTTYTSTPPVNLKEAYPFSSVGLNLGLKLNF